jgi:hypothetical protein
MTGNSEDDGDELSQIHVQEQGILSKLFRSCSADPRGSVHRAWGISLLFVVLYFTLAILESEYQ